MAAPLLIYCSWIIYSLCSVVFVGWVFCSLVAVAHSREVCCCILLGKYGAVASLVGNSSAVRQVTQRNGDELGGKAGSQPCVATGSPGRKFLSIGQCLTLRNGDVLEGETERVHRKELRKPWV